MKKQFSFLLMLTILFGTFCVLNISPSAEQNENDTNDPGGVTGDCFWEYDPDSAELRISGEGRMADYDASRPWDDCLENVEAFTVVIGADVSYVGSRSFSKTPVNTILFSGADTGISRLTAIGDSAFYDTALTSVLLPASITALGEKALGYGASDAKTAGFSMVCPSGNAAAESYCRANGFSYYEQLDMPFFTGVQNTINGVRLAWNSIKAAPLYTVDRRMGDGEWETIGNVASNSYVDSAVGLTSGTVYTYRVRCATSDAAIPLSDCDNEVAVRYISAPSQIRVANLNGGQQITWGAVKGAQSYRVYRKTASSWKTLATVKVTSYINTEVKKGTAYAYTVCALSGGEKSGYYADGATDTYYTYPVISSLTCIQNGFSLKWNSIPGAVKYRVYRAFDTAKVWSRLKDVTVCSLNDTTVKSSYSGHTVYYTVRPISAAGRFITGYKPTGWGLKYILTPEIQRFGTAQNGLQLNWKAVKGASYYRVYRKVTGSAGWTYLGSSKTLSYTDTAKLVSGTSYSYTLKAFDASGKSSGYSAAGWKRVYIAAPYSFKATSTLSGVKLTWKIPKGAKYIYVYRKTASTDWKAIKVTNTASYLDTTAKKGYAYYYKLCCCDVRKVSGKNVFYATSADSATIRCYRR